MVHARLRVQRSVSALSAAGRAVAFEIILRPASLNRKNTLAVDRQFLACFRAHALRPEVDPGDVGLGHHGELGARLGCPDARSQAIGLPELARRPPATGDESLTLPRKVDKIRQSCCVIQRGSTGFTSGKLATAGVPRVAQAAWRGTCCSPALAWRRLAASAPFASSERIPQTPKRPFTVRYGHEEHP